MDKFTERLRKFTAEAASSADWFSQLSKGERQAYLKRHPHSKMKGAYPINHPNDERPHKSLGQNPGEKRNYHFKMSDFHDEEADRQHQMLSGNKELAEEYRFTGNPKLAKHHINRYRIHKLAKEYHEGMSKKHENSVKNLRKKKSHN